MSIEEARAKLIAAISDPDECYCGSEVCETADSVVDAFVETLATLVETASSPDTNDWNWWDAATIPASCAELLRRLGKSNATD